MKPRRLVRTIKRIAASAKSEDKEAAGGEKRLCREVFAANNGGGYNAPPRIPEVPPNAERLLIISTVPGPGVCIEGDEGGREEWMDCHREEEDEWAKRSRARSGKEREKEETECQPRVRWTDQPYGPGSL
ncbi:hypothetical protein KM043_004562 [Ampulex compressa]|nr:hypothetical protein KM043_004562 [Ampulex compressa]